MTSVRFHFLRHDTHRDLPALARLGFRLDSTQGYADRPGLRAGFSHPYRPYDLDGDRPLGLIELPLAVMDATLQDAHYLGLSAGRGLRAGDAGARAGRPRAAARSPCCGTTTASRRPTGAAGTVPTTACWAGSRRGGRLCAAEDVLAERF